MLSFFSSSTRMKAHVLVILCCLVVIGHSAFAATAINPATYCAPGQAINSRQCAARIKKCRAHGAIMKFTGPGCRNSRGKPVGDGGCQCSGYCAYSCSKPCVRDRQCYWNSTAAACFVKATNTIGAPILSCVPTHSPTTARPSQEPTMRTSMPTASPSSSPSSNPTMSPITTQPSKSPSAIPTTSKPSMTPSQTPSRTPSRAPSGTPSKAPSRSPSRAPSNNPSRGPSSIPSTIPSGTPSKAPSRAPSRAPSKTPSRTPSRTPSKIPSKTPSRIPSRAPSKAPSTSPSNAPVLVTCDLTTDNEFTGIWLDGVDMLSSVTPSGASNLNDWEIVKQITFEVDPSLTSQTIALSGQSTEPTSSRNNSGFTLICQSELLVWTFQTSIYENWVGVNGPTFPPDWEIGSGASVGTLQSTSRYCLNVAPYSEGCNADPDKYDVVKIWPVVVGEAGDPLQGIRKTIDSSTPNYVMNHGRIVFMPPAAGSTVILYSIGNTKSFRIVTTGVDGNLCIFDEPAGTITRCLNLVSSSTLFFFAFAGTTIAGYDNTVPPAAPGIDGPVLFAPVTSTGILYLTDDEYLCYSDEVPTPGTNCIQF